MVQDDDTFNRVKGIPRWAREGPDNPIFGLPARPGLPPGVEITGHFSIPCSSNCPAVPRRCKFNFGDICGQGCFCNNDPTLTPTPRPTPLPGAPTFEPSQFNGFWALTHRPTPTARRPPTNAGGGGGAGAGGVQPTPSPSIYYIPCSSNCPTRPAVTPLCGFYQTCGNGCYCGTAPGVPSPFPTRTPTLSNFFVISSRPSRAPSHRGVVGGSGSAPRSGQNAVTTKRPPVPVPVPLSQTPSPTLAPSSSPTLQPTFSSAGQGPAQVLPPAEQGGLRDGRHPGTDDHDENHAPEPAAGSNSAGTASKDSDTIGTGAIAGIAVGVVLVVLIAAAAFVIAKKKKQSFPGAADGDGTMDEIYAARKSAEISRLSGGFTPHLVVTRPSISHLAHPHASMSRNSMAGPRRASSSSTSGGSTQRQSFVPGNNLGGRERGAVAKVGHLMARPNPNPNQVYNSSRTPYDL